jgi:microcystin-dependent protein
MANTPNLDLILPVPGGSADVWGDNLNTDLTKIDAKFVATGPNRVVQTNAEGYPFGTTFVIDDATGTGRVVRYRTAGVERWALGVDITAEGIGNLGADFALFRYDNTGVNLDTAFPTILATRSTGVVQFGKTPQVIGSDNQPHDVVHLGNLLTSLGSITEPVGTVKMWVGGGDGIDPPGGYYMVCNGRGIPIPTVGVGDQTYVPLFQTIGTAYGSSGASFLIPNTAARVIVGMSPTQPPATDFPPTYNVAQLGKAFGVGLHTLTTTEIPAHQHPIIDKSHHHLLDPQTFQNQPGGGGVRGFGTGGAQTSDSFTGITNTENIGGGAAHDNIQPSLVMQFIIRVK